MVPESPNAAPHSTFSGSKSDTASPLPSSCNTHTPAKGTEHLDPSAESSPASPGITFLEIRQCRPSPRRHRHFPPQGTLALAGLFCFSSTHSDPRGGPHEPHAQPAPDPLMVPASLFRLSFPPPHLSRSWDLPQPAPQCASCYSFRPRAFP